MSSVGSHNLISGCAQAVVYEHKYQYASNEAKKGESTVNSLPTVGMTVFAYRWQ